MEIETTVEKTSDNIFIPEELKVWVLENRLERVWPILAQHDFDTKDSIRTITESQIGFFGLSLGDVAKLKIGIQKLGGQISFSSKLESIRNKCKEIMKTNEDWDLDMNSTVFRILNSSKLSNEERDIVFREIEGEEEKKRAEKRGKKKNEITKLHHYGY